MNKIKAIIFDFDGVICDSVNIKTEAFVELYSNYEKSISYAVKNIKGIIEFISNNSNIPKFICTGTPENEIKDIVQQRNIYSYFTDVFGSPKSKEQIINNILVKWKLNPNEVLFFGDAITDLNASLKCKLNFIGIKNSDTVFPINTKEIDDFFDKYLSELQFI